MKKKVVFASLFICFLLFLIILGQAKKSDWNLRGQELVKPVKELTKKDKLAIEVKTFALEENFSLSGEPQISGQTLIATFSGRTTVVFDLEKETEKQLASLQFILRRAKIEGRLPAVIDLRFLQPVLKY